MKEDDKFETALLRRLDILIALQLDRSSTDDISTSVKIARLLSLGASAAETAKILGKQINYVTAVMSAKNKSKRGTLQGKRGTS
jgi:hypothetical protein